MRLLTLTLTGSLALLLSGAPAPFVCAQDKPDAAKTADAKDVKTDVKPLLLTRIYKVGAKERYESKLVMQVGETEAKSTTTESHTVKEIKPTGETITTIVSEGGSVEYGGTERDLPSGETMLMTMDKSGKLSAYTIENAGASLMEPEIATLIATANHILFSDKPVAPGDKWETTLDDPAAKGKKITVKSAFVSVTKAEAGSKEAPGLWKLRQTVEADVEGQDKKAAFETTAWLDPANGHLIRSEGTSSNIPTRFGTMSWTSTVRLLKDDKKDEKKAADKAK